MFNNNMDSKINSIPLEYFIYSNFIKYDKLKEITLNQFANSPYANSTEINLFIDMATILRPLYKRTVWGDDLLLSAAVLNMCAHFRAYYWSRHGVITNIHIIHSDESIELVQDMRVLNDGLIQKMGSDKIPCKPRDEEIEKNISLLKLLVPYFSRLYFISGHVIPSVMINNLLNRYGNNNCPNIIITKDLLSWQIPTIHPNSFVFRPRKTNDMDASFCVERNNVWFHWRSYVNHIKEAQNVNLPPELLSLYIALTSFKERALYSYYSSKDAVKILTKLLEDRLILPAYNTPEAIDNVLMPLTKKKILSKHSEYENGYTLNLSYRYSRVDLVKMTNLYQAYPEASDMSWFYSKIDPVGLQEINDKYYVKNPIDIIRLYDNPGL